MSPLEPNAQQLWHNVPALMFLDFWQSQNVRSDMRDLGRMLGVLWFPEDAEEKKKGDIGSKKQRDELRIPLSCIVEPGIMDVVKQYFGKRGGIDPPDWVAGSGEEVVELYDVTNKDEFLQFVRGFVSPKIT